MWSIFGVTKINKSGVQESFQEIVSDLNIIIIENCVVCSLLASGNLCICVTYSKLWYQTICQFVPTKE